MAISLDPALVAAALDATTSGVAIADALAPDMPLVYVNAAFERMTGYAASEVLGRNCRFLQGPDRDQPGVRTLREALAAGRDSTVLLRNYRKDGTPLWNELRTSPIRDASGRVTHFVGVQHDVTELQRLTDELRLRESAIAAARNGIVIADATAPDRPLVYVNDAFVDISGYDREEILGRNCRFLQADLRDQPGLEALRAAIRDGRPTRVELRNFRKDGEPFWNELSIAPIRDGRGQLTHFVGVQDDVTRRKEAELELARANEALRVAREQAEAASRAKSTFLASMSHELRTPLNAILGYSELLREELDDPRVVEDLRRIHGAGEHLLALINDILDLSKIEAGRMELQAAPFDVDDMLRAVLATVAPLVERNGNRLAVDAPTAGWMTADATRVRQVLINLLGNAAKFTRDGEIRLSVRRDGDAIAFTVADSGIGIAPEHLGRLFEEFYQGDRSTTRRFGGTGLGLAISHRFVRMMGGDVQVQSAPGRGSTFRVILPVDARPDAPLADVGTAPAPAQGPVVLVIDDDRDVRELVARTLGREGYTVVGASDGEEGFQLAKRLRPAVVTLDVLMRGASGWTVLQRLKADPDLRHVPIVMLTLGADSERGLALGAAGHLTKPLRRQALLATIERCVGSRDRSVLVVDDDVAIRELVRRTLEREGWPVVTAADGQAALQAIERRRPAVVLLDLMMPGMDGFELAAALQADDRWRDIPIVVVTSLDAAEIDPQRLSGNVREVVQKSGRPAVELLRAVRSLIEPATAISS